MSESDTATLTRSQTALDVPWNVVVLDDPVNLMEYVTWVLMKVFGHPKAKAKRMMMEIHTRGKSVVWSGGRERAEHFVQLLHSHQLRATMEKSS